MITIKKITYLDFVSCENQLLSCIMELKNNRRNESELLLNNMATFLKDDSAIIYVAFSDHEAIGFIWGYAIDKNTVHINYFVVLKNYRRSGVGSKLLEKFLSKTDKSVELLVDKDNSVAIGFYGKRGFKEKDFNDYKYKMVLER